MTKPGPQTRRFYRAGYFRRGFAEVANLAWLTHLSDEERRAFDLRESFRAVHRDRMRKALKSRRFLVDASEEGQSEPGDLSADFREIAGNALADYVRLLKSRRSKH